MGDELGFPREKDFVNDIDRDYTTHEEKRRALIVKWKELFSFNATYKVFVEALLRRGKAQQATEVCKLLVTDPPFGEETGGQSLAERGTPQQATSTHLANNTETPRQLASVTDRQLAPVTDTIPERETPRQLASVTDTTHIVRSYAIESMKKRNVLIIGKTGAL